MLVFLYHSISLLGCKEVATIAEFYSLHESVKVDYVASQTNCDVQKLTLEEDFGPCRFGY